MSGGVPPLIAVRISGRVGHWRLSYTHARVEGLVLLDDLVQRGLFMTTAPLLPHGEVDHLATSRSRCGNPREAAQDHRAADQ